MNSKFDYDLLSAMMTNANMGWWEADLKTESYICSEYISRLLGLDEDGTISFKDFNKRILKEEQRHTTTHSFDNIRQTQVDCISAQHSRGSNVDKKQDMPAENR